MNGSALGGSMSCAYGLCSASNGSDMYSPVNLTSYFLPSLLESGAQLISDNVSDLSPGGSDGLSGSESETNDDFYENFLIGTRFWVQRVLVPLIMVIGMVGNSVTIVIMTRRRMRSSTNNYLAALATFDMLYLIFIFILSFAQYPNISDPKYYYYWKLWPCSLMITDACSNSSVWLTVTFTIERFIVVSHPIKGKLICTESRSRKVVLCVVLICFTYTLPTPFEWLIVEKIHPETNSTILTPSLSELGQNHIYKSIYYWLTAALFVFVPLLLLGIFNSFLIRSVHISRKERSDMTMTKSKTQTNSSSSPYSTNGGGKGAVSGGGGAKQLDPNSSKQENKITIMLIAVVILFFCCQLPTAVMLIFTTIHDFPDGTKEYNLIRGLNNIFNLLMAINAACNFLLYCLLSKRYRKTFVNVFCPCLKNKLNYFQSTYHPNTIYSKRKGSNAKSRSGGGTMDNTLETVDLETVGEDGHDLKVFSETTPVARSSRSPGLGSLRNRRPADTEAGGGGGGGGGSTGSAPESQTLLLTVHEQAFTVCDVGADAVVVNGDKKRRSSSKKKRDEEEEEGGGGDGASLITAPNAINLNSNSNYCDKDPLDGSPSRAGPLEVQCEQQLGTSRAAKNTHSQPR